MFFDLNESSAFLSNFIIYTYILQFSRPKNEREVSDMQQNSSGEQMKLDNEAHTTAVLTSSSN